MSRRLPVSAILKTAVTLFLLIVGIAAGFIVTRPPDSPARDWINDRIEVYSTVEGMPIDVDLTVAEDGRFVFSLEIHDGIRSGASSTSRTTTAIIELGCDARLERITYDQVAADPPKPKDFGLEESCEGEVSEDDRPATQAIAVPISNEYPTRVTGYPKGPWVAESFSQRIVRTPRLSMTSPWSDGAPLVDLPDDNPPGIASVVRVTVEGRDSELPDLVVQPGPVGEVAQSSGSQSAGGSEVLTVLVWSNRVVDSPNACLEEYEKNTPVCGDTNGDGFLDTTLGSLTVEGGTVRLFDLPKQSAAAFISLLGGVLIGVTTSLLVGSRKWWEEARAASIPPTPTAKKSSKPAQR